jgi:hypothetical protein
MTNFKFRISNVSRHSRLRLALAAVLAVASLFAAAAFASSGTTIDWWVFSGGGGRASGSGGVTVDSTLGQPITGVSVGGSAWLGSGYWYADQPIQLFLPLLRR